jgi:predicted phage tail protein
VPDKPTGPLTITNIMQNGCTISWAPPGDNGGSPIKSYVVEAREARRANWYQIQVVEPTETSLKITDLIENNKYFFRVSARNSIGLGDPLESDGSVAITRPAGCPETPFPLLVTDIQSDCCTLEWKAPSWTGGNDLLGYKIEMKIGDGSKSEWKQVSDIAPNIKTYTVQNLEEGSEYYFRISAFNAVGASKPLELNRPVIPKKQVTVPKAPTGPITSLKCNKDSISIQWGPTRDNGGAPVSRYIIYCREVNTNTWTRAGVVDSETFSYQVENLTENSEYHFRVVAENCKGPGAHLQTESPFKACSPYTVPDAPQGPLTVKNVTDKSATITWQKPKNDGGSAITGYLIKRRDVKRPVWVKCGRVGPDTFAINIKDLVEGCQYAVQVFAENSEGLSAPLESEQPIEPKRKVGVPELPASFECIGVDVDSVTLQWESPLRDGGMYSFFCMDFVKMSLSLKLS